MDLQLIKYIDRKIGILLCSLLAIFNSLKKSKIFLENPKKILLMKFSGFGNIVLALPTIRGIRKKYPLAEIVFLTHTINSSIIERDPAINKIITFDIEKGTIKTFINIFILLFKLRRENFDFIFDFEQFSRFSALVSFFSKAKTKIGFSTKGQGREKLYDIKVNYDNNKHTSRVFADQAISLGIDIDFQNSEVFLDEKDKESISSLLKSYKIREKGVLVGMHPGCGSNNPKRKWPKENFAKLADFLIDEYGYNVFFSGDDRERKLVKEIQSLMKNKSINLAGKMNIRELTELIVRCKFFVCSDTGPLHLASAMKIPTISFFGPNTPSLYGPLGENNLIFYQKLPCSPCTTNFNEKTTNCKHFKCINNITFQDVKNKIQKASFLK